MGTDIPTVAVLAGGLGTRLGPLANDRPKSLQVVAGHPFIFYPLHELATQGVRHVVICVGHLGDQIEATVGHAPFGLDVQYRYDDAHRAGTLGALRSARDNLGDTFLITYGDTFISVRIDQFARAWRESGHLGAMTVLHNENRWDRSNVAYLGGLVTRYEKQSADVLEWIDYGLTGLHSEALDLVPEGTSDLAPLFTELARAGELFGMPVLERFYEIGTPQSLQETDEYLRGRFGIEGLRPSERVS